MSAEPNSDYSACVTWGFKEGYWDLLDVYRAKLDFGPLKDRVIAHSHKFQADKILIEEAATGKPLMQQLRQSGYRNVFGVNPRLSKEVRFEAEMAHFMSGKYRIPETAPYLRDFKRELSAFPNGKYDDQVDAVSQFLKYSHSTGWQRIRNTNPVTGRRKTIRRKPRRR